VVVRFYSPKSKDFGQTKNERENTMASKSRKSLATFAAVSLGLGSVFVGSAPAQAVAAVSLAPTLGTSYTVDSVYNMSLETIISNSAVNGGPETLKYLITDLDGGLDLSGYTDGAEDDT
jgi:hypothetical protein